MLLTFLKETKITSHCDGGNFKTAQQENATVLSKLSEEGGRDKVNTGETINLRLKVKISPVNQRISYRGLEVELHTFWSSALMEVSSQRHVSVGIYPVIYNPWRHWIWRWVVPDTVWTLYRRREILPVLGNVPHILSTSDRSRVSTPHN